MATVRKPYTRSKPLHQTARSSERVEKTCFINDLIDGTIQAVDVVEVRTGNGKLIRLDYDDPVGAAPPVPVGAAQRVDKGRG